LFLSEIACLHAIKSQREGETKNYYGPPHQRLAAWASGLTTDPGTNDRATSRSLYATSLFATSPTLPLMELNGLQNHPALGRCVLLRFRTEVPRNRTGK
jgi:hypothetical protein